MQNKPTSKVIQISTVAIECEVITTVLCENGSVWRGFGNEDAWNCILEASNPATSTIPIPGSWQWGSS